MSQPRRHTAVVSARGQITLPKGIRQKRGWNAGTQLVVEETPRGVLLTAAPMFTETRPEDVYGGLPHQGPMEPGARALEVLKTPEAAEVLAKLRKYRGRLPEGFRFDRFEANER